MPNSERWEGSVISLRLPFPPTVNHAYNPVPFPGPGSRKCRCGKKWNARILLSTAGKAYCSEVARQVELQGSPRITGLVLAHLVISPPDRRRRDLSNYLKVLEDSLVKAKVLEDDSYIRGYDGLYWDTPGRPGWARFRLVPMEANAR